MGCFRPPGTALTISEDSIMPVKQAAPQVSISTVLPSRTIVDSRDLGVGTALWESVGGQWNLIKCGCAAGYEVSDPPTEPARYEGQILKTICEPAGV
jgi:hypothetical protein